MIRTILAAIAMALSMPAAAQTAPSFAMLDGGGGWWGVNIAGMEFKDELPITAADIDFYADAGVRSIRLPVKAERLATPAKLAALDALVTRGTSRGVLMVIDYHGYLRLDDPRVEAFWLRVGPLFRGRPLVAFSLQNEPKGDWQTWGLDAKTLVGRMRAAGIDNLLILDWLHWSSASRLDKAEKLKFTGMICESALCSLRLAGVRRPADLDPLNRLWLAPHRYFDPTGSGTSATCRNNLGPAHGLGNSTDAARRGGWKLYLEEFAWGRAADWKPSCKSLAPKVVAYLKAHRDVYVGGASWGWGPRWGRDYLFRGEKLGDRPGTWATENAQLVRSLWR